MKILTDFVGTEIRTHDLPALRLFLPLVEQPRAYDLHLSHILTPTASALGEQAVAAIAKVSVTSKHNLSLYIQCISLSTTRLLNLGLTHFCLNTTYLGLFIFNFLCVKKCSLAEYITSGLIIPTAQ